MCKGILGRKVGMTQVYDESGKIIPVTVIQAGPCHVLQLRTTERDGYEAVQLGYLDKPRRLAARSERGRVGNLASKRSKKLAAAGVEVPAKADCEPKRFVRELRGSTEGYEVGQQLKVDVLADVASVDVIGTSKGRGFCGRDEASWLFRSAGHARCEESAPSCGRYRLQCLAEPHLQGSSHGGPVRQHSGHGSQPEGCEGRRRQRSVAGPRRGSRTQWRHSSWCERPTCCVKRRPLRCRSQLLNHAKSEQTQN